LLFRSTEKWMSGEPLLVSEDVSAACGFVLLLGLASQ